jgi:hypothetical protein
MLAGGRAERQCPGIPSSLAPGATVRCELGDIAPGATVTVTIGWINLDEVTASASASATATDVGPPEPVPNNNASAATQSRAPDLLP